MSVKRRAASAASDLARRRSHRCCSFDGGASTYTLHAYFANVNGLVDHRQRRGRGLRRRRDHRDLGPDRPVPRGDDAGRRLLSACARARTPSIELGSLAGQLNRYVALRGGTGPQLPDGATIPIADTDGPVEIDQFLSALTPKVRAQLRQLLHDTVHTLDGEARTSTRRSATARRRSGRAPSCSRTSAPTASRCGRSSQRAARGTAQLAAEPAEVSGRSTDSAAARRPRGRQRADARASSDCRQRRRDPHRARRPRPPSRRSPSCRRRARGARGVAPFAAALRTDVPRAARCSARR